MHPKLQKHGPAFGFERTNSKIIVRGSFLEIANTAFERHPDCSWTKSAWLGHRVRRSMPRIQRTNHHSIPASNRQASHSRQNSPQNVYHAFTQGVQNKLVSLRNHTWHSTITIRDWEDNRGKVLPALIGKTIITEQQRLLFSLPLKNGGFDILSPDCAGDYSRSVFLSEYPNEMEPRAPENAQ